MVLGNIKIISAETEWLGRVMKAVLDDQIRADATLAW